MGVAEEISDETWDAWNSLLTPLAQLKLAATKPGMRTPLSSVDASQVSELYELALDLRDRLRYSAKRMSELKGDLLQSQSDLTSCEQQARAQVQQANERAQTLMQQAQLQAQAQMQQAQAQAQAQVQQAQAQAQSQAQQGQTQMQQAHRQAQMQAQAQVQAAETRLAAFHAEVARLSQGVVGQAAALSAHEATACALQSEAAAAERAHAAAASAAEQAQTAASAAEQRAARAEADRAAMLEELKDLRECTEDAEERAEHAEYARVDLMEALLATKGRVGELHQLEGLYKAVRDELARLDKENAELKGMVSQGHTTLGHSRIFDALSSGKIKSQPLYLAPEFQGKFRTALTGRRSSVAAVDLAARSVRQSLSRDVVYDDALVGFAPGGLTPRRAVTSGSPGVESPATTLPGMAWLGPPSAAYPADPEHFVYLRVAGGYSPKYVGVKEQPKASGWVPKDVVRVVQAFRHAYGVEKPEWRFWEPLLLLVDEVYRGQAGGMLHAARSANKDKVKSVRRQLNAASQYPSVLQAGRISHLKRQMEGMRRVLNTHDSRDERLLRSMAEKDYHLTNQLDEAVDENLALRTSLRDLDELFQVETGKFVDHDP